MMLKYLFYIIIDQKIPPQTSSSAGLLKSNLRNSMTPICQIWWTKNFIKYNCSKFSLNLNTFKLCCNMIKLNLKVCCVVYTQHRVAQWNIAEPDLLEFGMRKIMVELIQQLKAVRLIHVNDIFNLKLMILLSIFKIALLWIACRGDNQIQWNLTK